MGPDNNYSVFDGLKWREGNFIHGNPDGKRELIVGGISEVPRMIHDNGVILPGFINAHSHAFQYAMAGMAELITGKQDTFWTWREKMYELALTLQPDEVETIAACLYSEMLRNGYTHVVEFQYLHHQPNGKPYGNVAEMGERLVAAAKTAGIGITLCPMFYRKGGFGKPSESHQRRFISNSVEDYLHLLENSKNAVATYEGANLAYGIHSLRAADAADILELKRQQLNLPFHIHIAEQEAEVNDCLAYTGKRPVEYLNELWPLNDTMHLVHATHLTDSERQLIAESGAHVVLCPSTEANLGDGLFPFREFLKERGSWSIGSDSHVSLSPLEELRWLDYGQRLISNQRNTLQAGSGTFGEELYRAALSGGLKAAGLNSFGIFEDKLFTGLILDTEHPMLSSINKSTFFNALIYNGDVSVIKEVWTGGTKRVDLGRHVHSGKIHKKFKDLMQSLGTRY